MVRIWKLGSSSWEIKRPKGFPVKGYWCSDSLSLASLICMGLVQLQLLAINFSSVFEIKKFFFFKEIHNREQNRNGESPENEKLQEISRK